MIELERAREALQSGEDEAALGHLLTAWRESRAPRLAELLERVSARITKQRGAIKGKRVKDRHASWLEIEKQRDPADLERLMQLRFPSRWEDGRRWLGLLREWPDDPRIASGLAAQIANKPYTSRGSMPYWESLLSLLVRQRDLRAVRALEECNTDEFNYSSFYKGMFAVARVELEGAFTVEPELSSEQLAACEAIEQLLGVSRRRERADGKVEADFLAEIFAAPDRDEPRLVFADRLSEQGDERGEFIMLQCERARTGKAAGRRERALLKQHMAMWSGPLHPVLRSDVRVFERGFLAVVIGSWEFPSGLKPLVGEPHWATVRELTCPNLVFGKGGVPPLKHGLLLHPVMRSLRLVHNVDWEHATAFDGSERPLPLEELGFSTRSYDAVPDLGGGPGLPALRRLVLGSIWGAEDLGWLWGCPMLERIEALSLMVYQPYHRLEEYRDAVAEHTPPSLRRLVVMDQDIRWPSRPEGWWMTFGRDGQGRLSRLEAEFGTHSHYGFNIVGDYLAEALERLPPTALTAIRVTSKTRAFKPSDEQKRVLAAACQRFEGLEELELPFEV